jgi:hypothetical protein
MVNDADSTHMEHRIEFVSTTGVKGKYNRVLIEKSILPVRKPFPSSASGHHLL